MKTPRIVMTLLALTVVSLSSTQAFAWSSNRPEAPEAPIGEPVDNGDSSGAPVLQVCFADNSAGTTFRARGYNDQELIQGEAVRNCQVKSKEDGADPTSCRPLGCRAQ